MRRPTLRAAIATVLIGSAILVSVVVTGVVVLAARDIVYESREASLLDEFSSTADALYSSISSESSDESWQYYADILPGETAILDLDDGRIVGELTRSQIPPSLDVTASRSSGQLTYLRAMLNGSEAFFVSQVRDDLDQDPGVPLAVVTAYSLEPQRAQVRDLVTSAAVLSFALVFVVVILERLVGGMLTRPLKRLVATARELGSGRAAPPWRASFADVDRVADALHNSSRELSATMERLRDREVESRRLVSDVAHELRTPLTSMLAVEDILLEADEATRADRELAVSVVLRGTRRLHALVEQLLELSRMDAGVAVAREQDVDLRDLLQSIADSFRTSRVDVRCSESVRVRTDPGRVQTIVTNLLANAARHGEPPITIDVEEATDVVCIDVADDGGGIAPARREWIFDRFVTGDQSRARESSTGLGLAIAQENAHLIGGTLALREDVDRTTFRLTLPRP